MEEDIKFKELLKGACEETSHDFTAETMRRIEAVSASKPYLSPLLNRKIRIAFAMVFAIILTALFTISIFIQPSDLPYNFFIKIPASSFEHFYNLVSFTIAFWVLMFLNHFLKNRNTNNNWI
jgi:hypothetical protein